MMVRCGSRAVVWMGMVLVLCCFAVSSGAGGVIQLPVSSAQVKVTPLVPGVATGKQITSYNAAFSFQQVTAKGGKVSITVADVPVAVEEISAGSWEKVSVGKDSPFGIHDVDEYDDRLIDVGAGWVRCIGRTGLNWDAIETEKGTYDWTKTDAFLNELHRHNIRMLVAISTFNHWDEGTERGATVSASAKMVRDVKAYQLFLRKAVERYPFVDAWQVENEPEGFWKGTAENYVKLLKMSYAAIKKANPKALVVTGGVSCSLAINVQEGRGEKFWPQVFALLVKEGGKKRCFDVFDCHWFLHGDETMETFVQLSNYLRSIKKSLADSGYSGVPVWIGEMASYSGSPVLKTDRAGSEKPPKAVKPPKAGKPPLMRGRGGPAPRDHQGETKQKPAESSRPEISETQHATELVRLYVQSLGEGISRIFWVRLIEWSGYAGKVNGYFDNTGLINNPKADGETSKKLAYYSYKKLAELLRDCEWSNVIRTAPAEGVSAYRFKKNGRSIFIVWTD